jgi:hypothetical protein
MGLLSRLFGSFSTRSKATALYKRGMHKASDRDLKGAIVDYTAVVEMKGAPHDVIAMALLNRALAYSREHDDERAAADLDRVLAMPDATAQVKDAAKEKLHRMKRRSSRHQ